MKKSENVLVDAIKPENKGDKEVNKENKTVQYLIAKEIYFFFRHFIELLSMTVKINIPYLDIHASLQIIFKIFFRLLFI